MRWPLRSVLAVGAVLLAWHVLSFSRTVWLVLNVKASSFVREPPGLAEALRAQTAHKLTDEDRQTLERDGVVRLRGVVNASILNGLESLLWDHGQDLNLLSLAWYYNGAVRALLRDGNLGALAAQALGQDKLWSTEMLIWTMDGGPELTNPFMHSDDRADMDGGYSGFLTIWFAVTDAPLGMDFVRGSHRHTSEIYRRCRVPDSAHNLLRKCIEEYAATNISQELGYDPFWRADAAAGDVILFYSHVVHIGVRQPKRRTAICIRARGGPRAKVEDEERCLRDVPYHKHNPVLLHPRSAEVDCLPWHLIPEMGGNSPQVPLEPGRGAYWAHIYRLHWNGQLHFIKRSEHSQPRFADLEAETC